ncbi:formate/nitrite transporter family protein [Vaginisenegalia massiliensis]|uniref:formate/nitrite transporter family protein n=1 Tax=Vaginisenegalia massiliensis TaxID=2058294 RepID=UPI000F53223C|nr:formate/nitrite transporter family protein [Vaginisenegalia massiliensis]
MSGLETSLSYLIAKNAKKKEQIFNSSILRYSVRSMNASLFLTLGTAISIAAAQKAVGIHPDLPKFLFGFLFSWSLVMIVFMNGELATSNMMYMVAAAHRKDLSLKKSMTIMFYCTLFNLIGAIVFTFLLSKTGTFANIDQHHYLMQAVQGKLDKSSLVIFVEGIFANIVVNIAVVGGLRLKDDTAKIIFTLGVIFIFAFLGYEHVIANFITFSLAFFTNPGALTGFTLANVLRQWFFAFLGNFVGGGLIIGAIYSWLNQTDTEYID